MCIKGTSNNLISNKTINCDGKVLPTLDNTITEHPQLQVAYRRYLGKVYMDNAQLIDSWNKHLLCYVMVIQYGEKAHNFKQYCLKPETVKDF